MAASGLTANTCDRVNFNHVTAMADYALQLFDKIEEVNMHSFNNFRMRIGEAPKLSFHFIANWPTWRMGDALFTKYYSYALLALIK